MDKYSLIRVSWQGFHNFFECLFSITLYVTLIFHADDSVQYIFSRAFDQAGRAAGQIFCKKGDVDIEKIKQSKHFRALLKQYNEKAANELVLNSKELFFFMDWIFLLPEVVESRSFLTFFCLIFLISLLLKLLCYKLSASLFWSSFIYLAPTFIRK